MNDVIANIRYSLQQSADAKTKSTFQRFFKEEVSFYGVKSALVVKIAKANFLDIKGLDKKDIFALCEELFKSGLSEESWIAANWVAWLHAKFTPHDFDVFERWIDKYIDNWAACDTFCNHAVGSFIEMYPEYLANLKSWAKSKNRWLKRASAVSLIIPAKKGLFLKDIFEIADILLLDQDDMVQKGYGWMLKEASRLNTDQVFDYVIKNKTTMPRTALRYAIEKMPASLKKEAMKK